MTFTRPSLSTKEIINVEERKVSPRFALPVGVEGATGPEAPGETNEGLPAVERPDNVFTSAEDIHIKSQTVVARNGQIEIDVIVGWTPPAGVEDYEIRITRED